MCICIFYQSLSFLCFYPVNLFLSLILRFIATLCWWWQLLNSNGVWFHHIIVCCLFLYNYGPTWAWIRLYLIFIWKCYLLTILILFWRKLPTCVIQFLDKNGLTRRSLLILDSFWRRFLLVSDYKVINDILWQLLGKSRTFFFMT